MGNIVSMLCSDFIIYSPFFVCSFWSIVIFLSNRNKADVPKFVLGIFMAITALLFLSHIVYYKKLKEIYLYFDLIFISAALAVYPLYFWYIKLLCHDSRIKQSDYFKFIPSVTMFFIAAVFYAAMPPEGRKIYIDAFLFDNRLPSNQHWLLYCQQSLTYLLQLIYPAQIIFTLVKSSRYINAYNQNVSGFYADVEGKTLNWLKTTMYALMVISILSVVFNFMGRTYFLQSIWVLAVPSLSFSGLLFIIGYLGNVQEYSILNMEHNESAPAELVNENAKNDQFGQKLEALFVDQQLFKQNDLKITDVALHMNSNRTYISNYINTEYSVSFSKYVNRYRVEHAKQLLVAEQFQNFSLECIGEEAGFGSVHSFIRVFKEETSVTPGKYREFNSIADHQA